METLLTKHIYFITCISSQITPTSCQLAQMDNSPQAAFVDAVTTVSLHRLPNLQNIIFLPRCLAHPCIYYSVCQHLGQCALFLANSLFHATVPPKPLCKADTERATQSRLRVPRTEVSKEKGRGTARPGCCLLLPHIQTVCLHFKTNYLFRDVLMMRKASSHACTENVQPFS